MMNWKSRLLCGVMALTPVFVSGAESFPAAQKDAQVFEAVASRLDRGGGSFGVCNFDNFGKLLRPWLKQVMPEITVRYPLLAAADVPAQIDLLMKVLGLDAIEAYGFSTANVGDGNEPLFCSRSVLYSGDAPQEGVLWELTGENRDLSEVAARWPDNTVLGVDLYLDADKVIDRVAAAYPIVEMQLQAQPAFDLIVNAVTGPIEVLFVRRGEGEVPGVMMTISDRNNVVFNMLRGTLGQVPDARLRKDSLTIPLVEGGALEEITLLRLDNALRVITVSGLDRQIAERVAAGKTLAASADYRRLAGGVPKSGTTLAYYGPDCMDQIAFWQASVEGMQTGAKPQYVSGNWNQSLIGVAVRQKDAMTSVGYSLVPLGEYQVRSFMSNLRNGIRNGVENVVRVQKQPPMSPRDECSDLQTKSAALKQYAAAHDGVYPETRNAAALAKALPGSGDWQNCVFLGADCVADASEIENPIRFPLVVDLSGTNPDGVPILFFDGTATVMVMAPVKTIDEFRANYPDFSELGEVDQALLEAQIDGWKKDNAAE